MFVCSTRHRNNGNIHCLDCDSLTKFCWFKGSRQDLSHPFKQETSGLSSLRYYYWKAQDQETSRPFFALPRASAKLMQPGNMENMSWADVHEKDVTCKTKTTVYEKYEIQTKRLQTYQACQKYRQNGLIFAKCSSNGIADIHS